MNKKLLTLAIAACTLCGFTSMAQTQEKATECAAQSCPQSNCNNKMYQPQQFTDFAFEGILLDVNQQAKIDAINAQMKDAVNGNAMMRSPRGKDKKAPCDSAKCLDKAQKKGARPCEGRNGLQLARKAYAEQVKNVLTPDQYVMFLENIAFSDDQPQMGPQGRQQLNAKGYKDKAGKGKQCKEKQCQGKDCKGQECQKVKAQNGECSQKCQNDSK